jgi:hypothetical protein
MREADIVANGDRGQFLKLFEENVKQPVRDNPAILTWGYWR